MTNIRGNHIALVEAGRAGPDVVIADANQFFRGVVMEVKENALSLEKFLSEKGLLAKYEAIAAVTIEQAMGEEKPKDESAVDQDPLASFAADLERLKQLFAVLSSVKPDVAEMDKKVVSPKEPQPMGSDKKSETTQKEEIIAVDEKKVTANVMAHF
jgi:hypothetical protein